ncbi:nucleolar protein 4 like [Homo sapiens]|uniref:Nucleolar protein 4 like n=2 Tax=Homininae TaxID=207598 RepID=A0A1W2PQU1_HUMAN|nr:nucleolar protein 4 like [Homo sapiens]KAI4005127.1 nucleolar protein 4 like [Homo sapiens]
MSDSTWMSADPHLASSLSPSQDERMRSPQNLHSQEDDDSSSESGSGNGSSTLNPSTSSSTQGDPAFPEMNGNGAVAPMDFTTAAEDQPINLCDKLPPATALGTASYPSDGCGADGLRSRVKYGVKTTPEVLVLASAEETADTLLSAQQPREPVPPLQLWELRFHQDRGQRLP